MRDTVAPVVALAVAGLALAGVLWWARRPAGSGSVALDVGAAVGEAAADAASGLVLGIGDAVGIPRTDETECARAMREGRWWDASFACPAGTFIGGVFGRTPEPPSPPGGASGSW